MVHFHRAVKAVAVHKCAILAAEVFDRDAAARRRQPGMASRNCSRVNDDRRLRTAADHDFATIERIFARSEYQYEARWPGRRGLLGRHRYGI